MSASFVVYIDESGDEGLRFGGGASGWFVLSAVVTRKSNDLETVKLVDTVRSQLGKAPGKPLHFRDLRHEHRVPFIDKIAAAPLRVVTVLVHKPSILAPEVFERPHLLYFYSVRHLLERVSWLCRDHRREEDGDGTAEIVFSNRSGMSYEALRQYMQVLEGQETSIDWSAVRCDQINAFTAGRRMGLQIADAVASGFFKAVEPSQYGHTEDRYARMLRPVVYNRQRCYQGYGLKFWPREAAGALGTPHFRWLQEVYAEMRRTLASR
jgi:hypothetical protein